MAKKEDTMRVVPVKEEEVKRPAANRLSKQKIEKLFRMFCVYTIEYKGGENLTDDCSLCVLRDIPWVMKGSKITGNFRRDLCFAIWHEDILNNA